MTRYQKTNLYQVPTWYQVITRCYDLVPGDVQIPGDLVKWYKRTPWYQVPI